MKISDHAHAVFCSISLIQLLEPFTGKIFTGRKTKFSPGSFQFFAVLYNALNARLRFIRIGSIASDAVMILALVGHTECAIHSAGSNEETGDDRMR